jgi:WD40 repeat protein
MRFSQDEKYLLEVQYREPLQYGNPRTSYVFIYDFIGIKQLAYYEMQREFSGEYEACYVNDADISPDNSMIFFACEDGTLLVTELLTGQKIARWQAFNKPVTEVSISEEGTRLTAGASGLIKMWDVP